MGCYVGGQPCKDSPGSNVAHNRPFRQDRDDSSTGTDDQRHHILPSPSLPAHPLPCSGGMATVRMSGLLENKASAISCTAELTSCQPKEPGLSPPSDGPTMPSLSDSWNIPNSVPPGTLIRVQLQGHLREARCLPVCSVSVGSPTFLPFLLWPLFPPQHLPHW